MISIPLIGDPPLMNELPVSLRFPRIYHWPLWRTWRHAGPCGPFLLVVWDFPERVARHGELARQLLQALHTLLREAHKVRHYEINMLRKIKVLSYVDDWIPHTCKRMFCQAY